MNIRCYFVDARIGGACEQALVAIIFANTGYADEGGLRAWFSIVWDISGLYLLEGLKSNPSGPHHGHGRDMSRRTLSERATFRPSGGKPFDGTGRMRAVRVCPFFFLVLGCRRPSVPS